MNAGSCLKCFKIPEDNKGPCGWPKYPYSTGIGPTNHGNAVPDIPLFRRIVSGDSWGCAWSYWVTQKQRDKETKIHEPGKHSLRLGADGELVRMD